MRVIGGGGGEREADEIQTFAGMPDGPAPADWSLRSNALNPAAVGWSIATSGQALTLRHSNLSPSAYPAAALFRANTQPASGATGIRIRALLRSIALTDGFGICAAVGDMRGTQPSAYAVVILSGFANRWDIGYWSDFGTGAFTYVNGKATPVGALRWVEMYAYPNPTTNITVEGRIWNPIEERPEVPSAVYPGQGAFPAWTLTDRDIGIWSNARGMASNPGVACEEFMFWRGEELIRSGSGVIKMI